MKSGMTDSDDSIERGKAERRELCELVEDYIARTYGVEQSELISRLDTFATSKKERKA